MIIAGAGCAIKTKIPNNRISFGVVMAKSVTRVLKIVNSPLCWVGLWAVYVMAMLGWFIYQKALQSGDICSVLQ